MRTVRHGRAALWFCTIAVVASGPSVGCSSPDDEVGTLIVNLTGRGTSGAVYRLRDAIITIQGPTSTQRWNTEDDPGRTSLSADVDTGDYSALLEAGWRLERIEGAATQTVSATLLSDNPVPFTVTARQRTSVPLRFRADGDAVDMTQGYDIAIDVQDDLPLVAIAEGSSSVFPGPGIETLPARAGNNVAPLRIITGQLTELGQVNAFLVADGEFVVGNSFPSTINFYPLGADDDIAPTRQIRLSTSNGPDALAASDGELYASIEGDIQVFAFDASGDAVPTRTLTDVRVGRLAIDNGELYATLFASEAQIAVYSRMASGAQAPTRTMVTSALICQSGLAIHGGEIYVSDSCSHSVVVLPETASGTVAPVRVLAGPSTGLRFPAAVAVFEDELYVADFGVIRVYSREANGDVAPIRTLAGNRLGVVNSFAGLAVFRP